MRIRIRIHNPVGSIFFFLKITVPSICNFNFKTYLSSSCAMARWQTMDVLQPINKAQDKHRIWIGHCSGLRLSLLTNSALVYESQCRGMVWGGGGVAGSQPMSTAVHITWHGDLPPYLTFGTLALNTGYRLLCICNLHVYSRSRILIFYPSRIPDPDFYPSLIPDLGSRIHQQQKRRGNFFVLPFFVANKFTKL